MTLSDLPALGNDIPVREIVTGELKGHRLGFFGLEKDGVEAFQVIRRLVRGRGRGGVQLRDLRAGHRTGVRERECDSHDWVVEPVHAFWDCF